MAEQRELEVTVLSAQDLRNVNSFGKMSPYVELWIHSSRKHTTQVHTHGGINPSWNELVKLRCEESLIEQGNGTLHIEILNHGSLSDKEIGSVSIPLSQVITRDDRNSIHAKSMSFQVQKPSGGVQGVLHLSVKLGPLIASGVMSSQSTSTAYPPTGYPPAGYDQQQRGASNQYQYPPQLAQAQYAQQGQVAPQYAPSQYAPPPPQGQFPPQYAPSQYGQPQYAAPQYPPQYAPPPQGYYAQQPYVQPVQVVQQQPARSGLGGLGGLGGGGLGLGAGLLGGAVGGLVLGDVLDDFGNRNDGGGCGGGGGGGGCGGGGCGGN